MKQIVLATACSAALLGAGVVQSREFLSTPPQGAAVPSPMPTVTGPVKTTTALRDPGHGYPFSATPMDLAKAGYAAKVAG